MARVHPPRLRRRGVEGATTFPAPLDSGWAVVTGSSVSRAIHRHTFIQLYARPLPQPLTSQGRGARRTASCTAYGSPFLLREGCQGVRSPPQENASGCSSLATC